MGSVMGYFLNEQNGNIHPYALAVARSKRLPPSRLAYLDDPDVIDEYATLIVQHRERDRQRRLALYWSCFYGGTGGLIVLGVLVSLMFMAVAALWMVALVVVGVNVLTPAE
ncbi:MAG TPA: hypothetical protein VHV31_16685 [Nitrolancea sp.]|nr:hypothetical protein [Nitrolancea sp.]